MLRNSSIDYSDYVDDDDDDLESSIYDLDHAPAPRVSSMLLSPLAHHHSTNHGNNILLHETVGSNLMIPSPPPPPSSISASGTAASRLRLSSSISPRPTSGGRMSRKSIVIPMGEHHAPVLSLPPTAAPSGAFSTASSMSTKDSAPATTGSSSLLGPITSTFHRRRLSSYSSIPTVGGSYMYGSSSNNNSFLSSSNASSTLPHHPTTTHHHHINRQRSYSATAIFSNTTSPNTTTTTAVPSHLAHVRSFPPPYGGSGIRFGRTTVPPAAPPRTDTTDRSYVSELYSPSVSRSVPIIRIEESKEPTDGDDAANGDLDVQPQTDNEYEAEVFHTVRIQDHGDDPNMMSDSGFSSGSEQPLSFVPKSQPSVTSVGNPDTASVQGPTTENPTFLYPNNDLSESRNYDLEDSMSQNHHHHDTNAIQPARLCGCIPLPRCFSKRRISWDRTFLLFVMFMLFRRLQSIFSNINIFPLS